MLELRKLKNGIRVVLDEIPYVSSVSMGIWVKAGAVYENNEKAGISHLIEHMMFKGTETRNARELAEGMDRIGAQMNAFTGKELTCYHVKSLSSNFDKAAEILLDMFVNSKFDKVELDKEKQVIYEEMKMIEDTPDEYAHENLSDIIFKGSKYENSIIGTPESVGEISREDIKKYISEQYSRDSIVVSVVGKFDKDAICEKLEKGMEKFTETKDVFLKNSKQYRPGFKLKIKDIEQTHVCLGTRALKVEDHRTAALKVLNSLMGGTMSSRLFQNIREEKGLAYSVYSHFSSLKDEGEYSIYAGVSHEKASEAVEAIKEELKKLRKYGITRDEFSMAKEQIKASYIFGYENINSRMFYIGRNLALLDKIKEPEDIIKEIDVLTEDDTQSVIDIVSSLDNYSAVVVTKKEFDVEKLMRG